MVASVAGELPQKGKEMLNSAMSKPYVLAGLLVAGLLMGWIGRGLISQPPDAPTISVFKNWQLICPAPTAAKGFCTLSQNVIDPKSGGVVIRFVMSADEKGRKVALGAPFNVLLPPGIGMKVNDGKLQTFAYKTCNGSGCIASIDASEDLYNGLLHAKKIDVFYENLNTKTSGWAVSMDGFDDAVGAMKTNEANRHSWLRRVLL
jgi:invasion protein IalB